LEVNRDQIQGLCGLKGLERPIWVETAINDLGETITHARREYLAEIYRLQYASPEPVTTTALAARLSVSPPAVARMVQRLAHEGYVQRKPYKGVSLTPEGEREALRSIRRHRLLEAFLVTVMQFGWDEVHDHARALEGAINDAFEERIDLLAGRPTHCPHGDPIPTKDGLMPPINDCPLDELPQGARGVIRRAKTDDGEQLRYLAEIGLVPGTPITLTHRAVANGTLRVTSPQPTGPTEHVLGNELAQTLRVEIAAEDSISKP
jgi:DtxR family Mn-dependent transcriptional regulator